MAIRLKDRSVIKKGLGTTVTHNTTTLKIIFYITIVFFSLTSCSTSSPEKENKLVDALSVQPSPDDNPKVEVTISLIDTILNSSDKIFLNITVTNASSINQRLLFDNPSTGTGGPWATSATVIDNKTNKTVLEYQNKAVLSSQLYTEDQLKDRYYNLNPKQSISGKYELSDIVVFNTVDNKLPKGTYTIQLFYYHNISNSLTLTIK